MGISAMSRDLIRVRVLRPHDTDAGLRSPGDEYERTKADADALTAAGVVEIVAAKAKPKGK